MMKKILTLIVILATMQSCNKFGDTNVSPTLLTKASTSALLTNSQQAMKTVMYNNRLANLYVQHLSEGPYPGSSLYSDRNASFLHCTVTVTQVLQDGMLDHCTIYKQ